MRKLSILLDMSRLLEMDSLLLMLVLLAHLLMLAHFLKCVSMDASYEELKKKLEEVQREKNIVVKLCKIYEEILHGMGNIKFKDT